MRCSPFSIRQGAHKTDGHKKAGCEAGFFAWGGGREPASERHGFFNDHIGAGHVFVKAFAAGGHGLDGVHHVLAGDDFAEDGVAPALRRGGGVVEKAVVGHVDEELRGGRVRVARAGHGHHADGVVQALGDGFAPFVLDRGAGGFLLVVLVKAAALHHEAFDDTVKDGAVVELVVHVLQKVFNGFGGFVGV